jgi:hypothetical protein
MWADSRKGSPGRQVAGLAAYLAAGVVHAYLGPHELQEDGEAARYGALLARQGGNPGELAEQLDHPFFIDSRCHMTII